MAKTYNRLELDVNKKPNSIGIRPVQGDTKSRYLDVCLYENGAAINLTGEQVRITFRKADGSTFFNQGEVTDATAGRCQFALTNEILAEAKALEAQISIWNAGGEILSTQVFEIYVSAAIPWTDAVESENEYGVLVVLFQEIQNALDTMQAILDTFGEPGDKAAEYGVDTFWGILEFLAQRGDVDSALEKKVKAYLNSTVGTSSFQPLNDLINGMIDNKIGSFKTSVESGSVPIVRHVQRGTFSIASSSTSVTVSLTGFSNLSKMIVLINGNRASDSGTGTSYPGQYSSNIRSAVLSVLALSALSVSCRRGNSSYAGDVDGSYQVIEFY